MAGAAGCSDGGDGDAVPSTSTAVAPEATGPPRTTLLTVPDGPRPGAGSTFCTSMLRLGQLNPGPEAAPDEVLALTEQLLDLLGEAQANTPEDAPPAIDVLLDDFRVVATALFDAGGDVEAAYAALESTDPEAFARFSTEGARDEAYAFLTVHCGTTPP